MILAVSLADGQIVGLSSNHVMLLTKAEGDGTKTEVTMENGKKFVLNGSVQDLAHKFNVRRS